MERGPKPPWALAAAPGTGPGLPGSQHGAQRAGRAVPGLASPALSADQELCVLVAFPTAGPPHCGPAEGSRACGWRAREDPRHQRALNWGKRGGYWTRDKDKFPDSGRSQLRPRTGRCTWGSQVCANTAVPRYGGVGCRAPWVLKPPT